MFYLHVILFTFLIHWISCLRGKYFDRVVIIVFENQHYTVAKKNSYISGLTSEYNGFILTNYLATTHPSQPNYISLISGSTHGTFSDLEVNINRKNIVDLLEAKGISWKTYQEDYPGGCNTDMRVGAYARKHNPFISFKNIQSNATRCSQIVNSIQLDKDIIDQTVPQFVFYTPNIYNDAHDTNLEYASNWLRGFLALRIQQKAFNENTMFVLTFDEDNGASSNNKVFTTLFGPDFHPSTDKKVDNTRYNHYSLLKTIEDNWDLGDLDEHDKKAKPIQI